MSIPSNTTIYKNIYSPEQNYYDPNQGWETGLITVWDVKIILCVRSDGNEKYYTIHVKPIDEKE